MQHRMRSTCTLFISSPPPAFLGLLRLIWVNPNSETSHQRTISAECHLYYQPKRSLPGWSSADMLTAIGPRRLTRMRGRQASIQDCREQAICIHFLGGPSSNMAGDHCLEASQTFGPHRCTVLNISLEFTIPRFSRLGPDDAPALTVSFDRHLESSTHLSN